MAAPQRRLQQHLHALAPSADSARPAASAADSAAPSDPARVTVSSYFGEQLDLFTLGRCQEILQRSFHGDPNRKGYYIPLPEDLLLTGAAKEAAVDRLLAQAVCRRERWHLAFGAILRPFLRLSTRHMKGFFD